MTSGRLPGEEPKSNITFSISDKTNAKLSLLIHDPVSGRARYGLKSKVTEELIKRFFEAFQQGKNEINVRDLRIECQLD